MRTKHKLVVGERYGMLVVLTTEPATFRCDCGKTVTNRTPYMVKVLGTISCGCRQYHLKPSGVERRKTSPNYELIGEEPTSGKAAQKRWRVRCRKCQAELTVADGTLKDRTLNHRGCRLCATSEGEHVAVYSRGTR